MNKMKHHEGHEEHEGERFLGNGLCWGTALVPIHSRSIKNQLSAFVLFAPFVVENNRMNHEGHEEHEGKRVVKGSIG